MTNLITPFDAALKMQRNTIAQSKDFLQRSLELQQGVFEAFVYSGVSVQQSAHHRGVDFLTQMVDAQLDVYESALDDETSPESFEEQFEEFETMQRQAVDDFETKFGDGFRDMSADQKRLVAKTIDAALTAQRQALGHTDDSASESEPAALTSSEEVDAVAEMTQRQIAKDVRAAGPERRPGDHSEKLETIEGLGETYADRLRNSGIQSVEDLSTADPTTVAEAADINEANAEKWVSSAQAAE